MVKIPSALPISSYRRAHDTHMTSLVMFNLDYMVKLASTLKLLFFPTFIILMYLEAKSLGPAHTEGRVGEN